MILVYVGPEGAPNRGHLKTPMTIYLVFRRSRAVDSVGDMLDESLTVLSWADHRPGAPQGRRPGRLQAQVQEALHEVPFPVFAQTVIIYYTIVYYTIM